MLARLGALRGVFGFHKICKMSLHVLSHLRRPSRRIFGLPELVLLATVLSCAQAQPILCLKEYKKRNPQHTACQSPINLTGLPSYGGQSVHKNIVLGLLNSFRSNVAVGNCKDFPSASNMLKLEWDEELFNLAYMHASYLLNVSNWPFHDDVANRFTMKFEETGQSVTRFYNASHRYVSYWNAVIREWFAEHARLAPSAVRYYETAPSTENVTQMWWAETGFVGCSYSTMVRELGWGAAADQYVYDHAYVCNFGPAGNQHGRPIYAQGPPCSRCPKGTKCEPTSGLCGYVEEPPWPEFRDVEVAPPPTLGAAAALAPAAALVGATAALHVT